VCAGVLTATGQRYQAEHVTVKGPMGEGSYGQVFEVSYFLRDKLILEIRISFACPYPWVANVFRHSLKQNLRGQGGSWNRPLDMHAIMSTSFFAERKPSLGHSSCWDLLL
jgi:hypothetical protein